MRTTCKFLRFAIVALAVTLGAGDACAFEIKQPEWKTDFRVVSTEEDLAAAVNDATTNKTTVLRLYITASLTLNNNGSGVRAIREWIEYVYKKGGSKGALAIVAGLAPGCTGDDGARYRVTFNGGGDQLFNFYQLGKDNFHARFIGITFTSCTGAGSDKKWGGAIYAKANASFYGCTFKDCKAENDGGAIYKPGDVKNQSEECQKWVSFCGHRVAVEKCKFSNCIAESAQGGAIYGAGSDGHDNIYDSEFVNCKATKGYAGAIYKAYYGILRCTFKGCEAPASYGGALYACGHYDADGDLPSGIRDCLFVDCKALYGGALSNGSGADSRVHSCTFINCPASDSKYKHATYDAEGQGVYLYNSLFYGCEFSVDKNHDDNNVVIDDKNYFYSYDSGDYHFNVCDASGSGGYANGPNEAKTDYFFKKDGTIVETDRDGANWKDDTAGYKYIVGCYRYYTKEQWQEYLNVRKPFEYDSGCDPLTVTTTKESGSDRDMIVSFREALTYFSTNSIRYKSEHPNEILFQLNGSVRTITLTNGPVTVARGETPLTINGGDGGITLRHSPDISGSVIRFEGNQEDVRIFRNVTVQLCLWATVKGMSTSFRFVNCAFQGGDTVAGSGGVGTTDDGWDREGIKYEFERCTFSGYKAGGWVVEPGALNTELTFDACTFTGNSAPGDSNCALIHGIGKSVSFRNCTFFDNAIDTMRKNERYPDNYPTENYFNCIICESRCNPSADSSDNAICDTPADVFDSAVPVKTVLSGVTQIGIKPKHKGTARGGHASYDDWRKVPECDIFNQPMTSRYCSQGSWFVDDREVVSLTVNHAEDVDDPYDDFITLREVVAYAADAANKELIVGRTVRPIFSATTFPGGRVSLALERAIPLTGDIYANYPLELQPGKGQTLTISAPTSPDGAFQIGYNRKMRVKDTTFKSCVAKDSGGAISSLGQLTVNGCRFDSCEANASGGVGGALFLADESRTFVHATTFADCKADYLGGAINNCGDLVAICVTLTGNKARNGSAVAAADADRTLFANATIAGNAATAASGGAFNVLSGVNAGLLNSIVAGNTGGNLAGSWSPTPTDDDSSATGNFYAYSLTDGTLADAFATASAIPVALPNGVTQSYYPLGSKSKAKNGAFVFVKGGLDEYGQVTEDLWPEHVGCSTSIDGFYPDLPREANGAVMGDDWGADFDGYALYDLTGALITSEDTGMGSVPSFPLDTPGGMVDTLEDVVDDHDDRVSLREAVDYAMANGEPVNFDPLLFSEADPVFRLAHQIVVTNGCSFELKAPGGHRITLLATAKDGNRFFRVENGGALKLEGITMTNGTARGDYGLMAPANDSDGGAVCGAGKKSDLAFANCAFFCNRAPNGFGGAVCAEGLLTVENCDFRGNSAGHDGGAVYSRAAMMTMAGGEVTDNSATLNGGGIGISPGNATNVVSGTTVTGNVAGQKGGGVYSGDGEHLGYVLLQDVIATGNRADAALSVDQNVFTGSGYTFNERYVLRVNRKYYEVIKDDKLGVERIELSEEASPVLGAIDLGSAAVSGKATVKVSNVIPGLEYGLGHAESPVGPYTVDKWMKATSENDLDLEAPAAGASGFYRVMAREAQ